MKSNSVAISGAVFSVPLFFQVNGEIDWESWESYIELICEQPNITCLYSMAFNTRYMQLSYEEVLEVNSRLCSIAKPKNKYVIIGHPLNLTTDGLNKYCEDISKFNPDGVSVLYPERYFGIKDVVIEYHRIPSSHGLGLLVHEMKLINGFNGELIDWPTDLLEEVLELPRCIGLKEDSKMMPSQKFVLS